MAELSFRMARQIRQDRYFRSSRNIESEMKVHQFDQASQSLAIRHNEKAVQLQQRGQIAEAVEYFQKAIKLWPSWAAPWHNLGLLRKDQRNWRESLRCNQKAVELDPSEEAAWWNLGIAATALGDWAEA